MYSFLRPLLFLLPPEWAHVLTLRLLELYGRWKGTNSLLRPPQAGTRIGKLTVPNRIGIAAGFDKDGIAINGSLALGIGFIELGAVTPKPQPGNATPRLFRLKEDRALINRLGFNNDGVDALARRLQDVVGAPVPIGVNIGKNANTPLDRALDDYVYCLERVYEYVDFVTVNVSSPNTEGLRAFGGSEQGTSFYRDLVANKNAIATYFERDIALFVKISPDLELRFVAELASELKRIGYDGVVATNTTETRHDLLSKHKGEHGGLSGVPLLERAVACIAAVRDAVGSDFTIIGSGGVWDEQSAQLMYDAGADLIQMYTSLVYEGPQCIRNAQSATPRVLQSA